MSSLRRDIQSAENVSNLSGLKRDIADIKRKLDDDIALVRRMYQIG